MQRLKLGGNFTMDEIEPSDRKTKSSAHGFGWKGKANSDNWPGSQAAHIHTACGNSGLAKQHHPRCLVNVIALAMQQHSLMVRVAGLKVMTFFFERQI